MRKLSSRHIIFLSTALTAGLLAQSAGDLNEGSRINYDSVNDTYHFRWFGEQDRSYFIQQSQDLIDWLYVPIIESGEDDVIEWGFATNADKLFLRLKYTDLATSDPETDDFDGDGYSNLTELEAGSDPFDTNDTPVPEAPGDLLVKELADGSTQFSWEDLSDNETGFLIEQSSDGGQTWQQVTVAAADSTETTVSQTFESGTQFRIAAQNQASSSTFTSQTDEVDYTPLPHRSYAVIEVDSFDPNDGSEIIDIGKSGQILWRVGEEEDSFLPYDDWTNQEADTAYKYWSIQEASAISFNLNQHQSRSPTDTNNQYYTHYASHLELFNDGEILWSTRRDNTTTYGVYPQLGNSIMTSSITNDNISFSIHYDPGDPYYIGALSSYGGDLGRAVEASESGRIIGVYTVLGEPPTSQHPSGKDSYWAEITSTGTLNNLGVNLIGNSNPPKVALSPDGNLLEWNTGSTYKLNNQGLRWYSGSSPKIVFPSTATEYTAMPSLRYVSSDSDGDWTALTNGNQIWTRRPDPENAGQYLEAFDGPYDLEELVSSEEWINFGTAYMNAAGMMATTAEKVVDGQATGQRFVVLLLEMEIENLLEQSINDAFGVSNYVTSQNLDNQASSVGDPRTYRVKLPEPFGQLSKVRFDIYEGGTLVDRNESEDGELPIASKTENGKTFYATDNFRFVTWDTDDAHAGNQTIKVKLGDVVRMTLVRDGEDVTYLKLPIGLPPSENSPRAIRTVDTRFIKLDYGNVVSDASPETIIERMDKVFAQGAVRFNKIDETTKKPVKNIIAINGNATATGDLILFVETIQENGTRIGHQVDTSISAGTPVAVAQSIAAAINAEAGSQIATSHNTYPLIVDGIPKPVAHVVIDQGEEVIYNAAVISEEVDGTEIFIPDTALEIGDANDIHAVAMLALNYGDDNPDTMDIFITDEVSVAGSGGRGRASPYYYLSEDSPIVGGYCIRLSASKDDNFDPFIAGHEAGHVLIDIGHPGTAGQLMQDGSNIETADSIIASKRIPESLINRLRGTSNPATSMLQQK